MHPADIRERIKGSVGKEILYFEKVGSTNALAMDIAEKVTDGTVVLADSQEKGKGRLGRIWLSPPGVNVYLSVILKPALTSRDAALLTFMAAVAGAHALRRTSGLEVRIKWPNDLVVSERKLGGILTETKIERQRILVAVIGIGLNVNMDIDAFPEDLLHTATSVKIETGRIFSREMIIAEILNEMDRWYTELKGKKREILLHEWQRLTSTLGRHVTALVGKEAYTGLADSVDDEGRLIIRLPSGRTRKISSGDITILR